MSASGLICESAVADTSTFNAVAANPRTSGLARAADYLELTKPKIAVLELLTVLAAGSMARWSSGDVFVLVHAMLGTALVAASASACNQWLERHLDARMPRTADRPLPAGRLSAAEALSFAAITGLAGLVYLAVAVNLLTALLGLFSWWLYVCVYTPMKPRTTLNTVVGAVAGGLPVLMGFSAVHGRFGMAAWALFLVVFLWQFPHFMAIAWLYRDQYRAAGMKMLPVVDSSGQLSGIQAVCSAMLLVPVSLLPSVTHFAGLEYVAVALVLGLGQLALAIAFYYRPGERTARLLLRASLVYLPVLLFCMIFCT
ncbi:MAG TPA: heme o synthase [Pirellulales bacterium]|jgi:protoheme IX farnesyltransferase|nr:heme o synthase [Pirellulales bacterium]